MPDNSDINRAVGVLTERIDASIKYHELADKKHDEKLEQLSATLNKLSETNFVLKLEQDSMKARMKKADEVFQEFKKSQEDELKEIKAAQTMMSNEIGVFSVYRKRFWVVVLAIGSAVWGFFQHILPSLIGYLTGKMM